MVFFKGLFIDRYFSVSGSYCPIGVGHRDLYRKFSLLKIAMSGIRFPGSTSVSEIPMICFDLPDRTVRIEIYRFPDDTG